MHSIQYCKNSSIVLQRFPVTRLVIIWFTVLLHLLETQQKRSDAVWCFVFSHNRIWRRETQVRLSVSCFCLGWNNSQETSPREGVFTQLHAERIHQTHACRRAETHTHLGLTSETLSCTRTGHLREKTTDNTQVLWLWCTT